MQMRPGMRAGSWAIMAGLVLVAMSALCGGAAAHKLKILHTFGQNQFDGLTPSAAPVMDAPGNLFGTTTNGGAHGAGAVYELTPKSNGKGYAYKIIYDFCSQTHCADGQMPTGGLIVDANGNLYGTALLSDLGNIYGGAAFELTHDAGRTNWTYTALYSFCAAGPPQCLDGSNPYTTLTYAGAATGAAYDGISPLYGSSTGGGPFNGYGVVFQLTPSGIRRTAWSESVLYDYCGGGDGCAQAFWAGDGIVADGNGNIFGAALVGGAFSSGAIFELPTGGTPRNAAVVYNFCSLSACADGGAPGGPPLLDAFENLFGTASSGGIRTRFCNSGCGTVFRLVPNGASWDYTVVHAFCAEGGHCRGGFSPWGSLLSDGAGSLFGTTASGGNVIKGRHARSFGGTLFALDTELSVLDRFCTEANCADGQAPLAGARSASGKIFGVTPAGGAGYGVIFEYLP